MVVWRRQSSHDGAATTMTMMRVARRERHGGDALGSRTTRQKKRGCLLLLTTSVRATSRMMTADPISKDRREQKTKPKPKRHVRCSLKEEDAQDAPHAGPAVQQQDQLEDGRRRPRREEPPR